MPLYMDLHSNLGRAAKFMTTLVIMLGLAATPASADTGCEYPATFESILEGIPGSEASGLASLLAQAAARQSSVKGTTTAIHQFSAARSR